MHRLDPRTGAAGREQAVRLGTAACVCMTSKALARSLLDEAQRVQVGA
jgi:hypothetical protein